MYNYEKIPIENDSKYLSMIDNIEELRNSLDIRNNNLSDIFNKDIYNSTKIEGNTLTAKEVTYYLENGVTVRGDKLRDYVQVVNYKDILNAMKEWVKSEDVKLTEDFILSVHKMITKSELAENESGVYRDDNVHIRTTSYIPPNNYEVPHFMNELINEYNKPLELGETQFERICEFKRNFERIHPFFDGNGRCGRVIMNTLFLKQGYAFITIDASERDLYFDSIENNTLHRFLADKMEKQMLIIQQTHKTNNIHKETDEDYER